VNHPPILLGTSSFTATGWQGSFYPKGLRPVDYLSYYAQHFDTVEINSTFYATPNVSVVRSWSAKTPEGFLFAAKVPQEITHTRVLKDCDEEFKVFLTTMEALAEIIHERCLRARFVLFSSVVKLCVTMAKISGNPVVDSRAFG